MTSIEGDADFRPDLLEGDDQALGSQILTWSEQGYAVRVVRGRKMRDIEGVFDEFASALQFPLYFGENKDAFDECMTSLERVPLGRGICLVITQPDQVLMDSAFDEMNWFANSLLVVSKTWGTPVSDGEWWDRPSVPFNVILAGEPRVTERARVLWSAAGVVPRFMNA